MNKIKETVWLVAERCNEENEKEMEFVGVFSSEELALCHCHNDKTFITEVNVDDMRPVLDESGAFDYDGNVYYYPWKRKKDYLRTNIFIFNEKDKSYKIGTFEDLKDEDIFAYKIIDNNTEVFKFYKAIDRPFVNKDGILSVRISLKPICFNELRILDDFIPMMKKYSIDGKYSIDDKEISYAKFENKNMLVFYTRDGFIFKFSLQKDFDFSSACLFFGMNLYAERDKQWHNKNKFFVNGSGIVFIRENVICYQKEFKEFNAIFDEFRYLFSTLEDLNINTF